MAARKILAGSVASLEPKRNTRVCQSIKAYMCALVWVIWRRDLKLFFRSLSAAEAWALDAFRAGGEFTEVCEGLCEWLEEDQVALNAASFLRQWITEGGIAEIGAGEAKPETGSTDLSTSTKVLKRGASHVI